uniref:Uncharacterized protein n=1 Tax=viral metagenome TaxID=1070528 RepID=A0A6C0BUL4_9ZZZZ
MANNPYLPQQAQIHAQMPQNYAQPQLPFLSNQNKELVYEILQENTKKKFRLMLSDIPDFVRILEDTFVDVDRSLGRQADTTTKNKQAISHLYKHINGWVSNQTVPQTNKGEMLARNYEAARQDFAKYKADPQKPTINLQEELDKEAVSMKQQFNNVNADDAYSLIVAQREKEEAQLKQIQKQNEDIAVAWLNPTGTPSQNTANHNKVEKKSNIVAHDTPAVTIDYLKQPASKKLTRETMKRHLPEKTVMFNNTVEVFTEETKLNTTNDILTCEQAVNSTEPDANLWWNKNFQKPQLNIEEKTLVTKNIHDNVVSLNEKFSSFKSIHINNIALPNRVITTTNELDMDIQSKISDLPYIYVEIFINGDLLHASSSQPKYMYRQDKEVGNYIYFTCNQSISSETNPVVATIALRFYDDHEEPLDITPLIKMETLINGTQITNKINKNTKFNDAQLSYIKVKQFGGEYGPNDVIQINDSKYKVVGVCKVNIRDEEHINIEGLNQTKDYNTMIVQLDKEIGMESKIMNLSRLPMVIVNIVK